MIKNINEECTEYPAREASTPGSSSEKAASERTLYEVCINASGKNAYIMALTKSQVNILKWLIDKGIDINIYECGNILSV